MPKRAVLLVNLGSPDSTSIPDVRRYLREFLGDERVLDMWAPARWALLEGIILRTRPKKSAHAYSKIWTEEGSPLVATSVKVQRKLAAQLGPDLPVYLAMRYGRPSVADAIEQMVEDKVEEVLLFPQYPHYAMASWETVVVQVYEAAAKRAPGIKLRSVQPFYGDADYLDALAAVTAPALQRGFDHVLFSYHGIPERHVRQTDPSHAHCLTVSDCCSDCSPVQATCYRAQCFATTRGLVKRLGLTPAQHSVSFQSRLAGEPWLRPFTDFELVRLPKEAGVKRLLILCPAFVADCLETLEEIAMTGKETFLGAGGTEYHQIPCLNDQQPYIDFLAGRVRQWLKTGEVRWSATSGRASPPALDPAIR
jgi:ferrochelatase